MDSSRPAKTVASRGVESAYRKWLYTPEAHVAKCKHGANPALCIACAYGKIESGEVKP